MDEHATTPRIVVGTDGSAPSIQALQQAPELTVALSCSLEAIIAWEYYVAHDSRFKEWSPHCPDAMRSK